jgi:hypothetical protein
VRAFVDDDPYVREGVYERVEIHLFACGLGPWAPAEPAPAVIPCETTGRTRTSER